MNLKLNKPLCFFDLETTGINIVKDRIVEIAVLKVSPDHKKDIIDEKYRVNPLTEYAKSKIDTEKSLKKLATNQFKIVCLRFGTACGVSNMIRLDLVLNDMVFNAVSSIDLSLVAFPELTSIATNASV